MKNREMEQLAGDRRSATLCSLPRKAIRWAEIPIRLERAGIWKRCEPWTSHGKEHGCLKMHRKMAGDGCFQSTRNLLAVRRRHHGLQVVGHGDDRKQHRDQNEIRDPRRRMRVNILCRHGPASASGLEQEDAQDRGSCQPGKIE
jgi:hypothetical protein